MAADAWRIAPPLTEEAYTLADALVVGTMLNALIRHADRVKIACIAQVVNALAPIMTVTGGPAWRQTTYYPLLHAARFGRGAALDLRITSPCYDNPTFGDVPLLDASATYDEASGEIAIFAVNRSQTDALAASLALHGFAGLRVVEHLVLEHPDPHAVNTADTPDRVVPHRNGDAAADGTVVSATLPRLSWNVIRLTTRSPHGAVA
jgi:alpha-N-arabinofuranosidase